MRKHVKKNFDTLICLILQSDEKIPLYNLCRAQLILIFFYLSTG